MVTGRFSGESGAGRRRSSGRWPVPRVWATHPNPAWRPKQPSFWPPFPPTLHRTVLRASPEPPRRLAVAPLIRDQRGDGESPANLRRGPHAVLGRWEWRPSPVELLQMHGGGGKAVVAGVPREGGGASFEADAAGAPKGAAGAGPLWDGQAG